MSEPVQDPLPEEAKGQSNPDVTPGRRALWVAGGLLGGYLIVRGLFGVITGEDEP